LATTSPCPWRPTKINWQLLGNEANRSLADYFKGLVALRKNNHALYTENINFFHEDDGAKVLAYVRWNGEGSRVAVVANFSDQFLGDYHLSHFPEAGRWHEWTKDYDIGATEDGLPLNLGEFEAQVFVWSH